MITTSPRVLSAARLLAALSPLFLAATPAAARHLVLETVDPAAGNIVDLKSAGDARLFAVGMEGRVWIYEDGVRRGPYLDLVDRVLFTGENGNEQGLLSVAFHPDYQSNGYLFAAYTARNGDGVVSRFQVSGPNPDQASKGSERILLRVPQPSANHNLNHLAFGPDGMLWIASGDGGYQPEPRCTPQETDVLLGKLLRLDVDQNVDAPPYHAIPADNPFVGDPDVRDEIWALGLRNAWRFGFDPDTGDLYIADVGHRLREEVDFLAAGSPGGQNYGFKMMEGFACRGSDANCAMAIPGCDDPAYTPPVLDYGHDQDHCAVIGGPLYRGQSIPELRGDLLLGDFCGGTGLARRVGQSWQRESLSTRLPNLVTFGTDTDGEVYLVAEGVLYRLVGLADDATVAFSQAETEVDEDAGVAKIAVRRDNGVDGPVQVTVTAFDDSTEPDDVTGPRTATLSWGDGEGGERFFEIAIVDDAEAEGNERLRLALSDPVGAELGAPSESFLTIRDDDLGEDSCVPSDTVLCLGGSRFQITAEWRNYEDETGPGHALPIDLGDSGLFWFFGPRNIELLVKVLDGCPINDRYWVYAAGTTDVEYTLRVIDTRTGALREYRNELGMASAATTDSGAFSTCP